MGYRVLADVTMVVHFAFLAYVAAGGYLAWRWPRAIGPHLLLAGWGLSTVAFNLDCPLTWIEDWARQRAGEPGLGGAFVDTYLTGVLYPADRLGLVQALVALSVAVSWVGAAVLVRGRKVRRRQPGIVTERAAGEVPERIGVGRPTRDRDAPTQPLSSAPLSSAPVRSADSSSQDGGRRRGSWLSPVRGQPHNRSNETMTRRDPTGRDRRQATDGGQGPATAPARRRQTLLRRSHDQQDHR